MYAKPIILALLAACGFSTGPEPLEKTPTNVASTAPEPGPNDFDGPHVKPLEDQHFCCSSVDLAKFTGEGCITIPKDNATINACANVLYCPSKWAKADGDVACAD
jgi:hypothetical protein